MNALPTDIGDRVRYLGPKAGPNPDGFLGTVALLGTIDDGTPYAAVTLDDTGDAVMVTDPHDLDPA